MLTVETMPVSELRPYKGNARTHSKKQVRQIANSITEFGFNNPILIGDDREIIAGHGRVEAAKLLGLKEVPTVRLSHLSPAQRRAYVIGSTRPSWPVRRPTWSLPTRPTTCRSGAT